LRRRTERTGRLERFLVFGSFVSAGADPRDVDIVLVMAAEFRLEAAPRESLRSRKRMRGGQRTVHHMNQAVARQQLPLLVNWVNGFITFAAT